MAKTATENPMVYLTTYHEVWAKIMEHCKDSLPYFQNHQYQNSLVDEEYTWTTNDTKLLLADMFQV